MNKKNVLCVLAAGAVLLAVLDASAQESANVVKVGVTRYDTHSRTNGITGVGVSPGADAETGDATTVIFTYERRFRPNVGIEFVMAIPPKLTGKATGSIAFLGDDILSAKIVAPTLLLNYHFGSPGDRFRPYLGAGINYTKFIEVESRIASDVKLDDSIGWALQAGLNYAITRELGLFASVARVDVKSKLVTSGGVALSTTIDFRPWAYSVGLYYSF